MTWQDSYGAVPAAADAPIYPILIVSPKRLEIAANYTKQITEVISNRIKTDPFSGPFIRIAPGTTHRPHQGLRKWKSVPCFSLLPPQAPRRIQESGVLEPPHPSLGRLVTAHGRAARQTADASRARALGAGRAARAQSLALELHHHRTPLHWPRHYLVEFNSSAPATPRSIANRPRGSRRLVRLLCLAPTAGSRRTARLSARHAGKRIEASLGRTDRKASRRGRALAARLSRADRQPRPHGLQRVSRRGTESRQPALHGHAESVVQRRGSPLHR